MVLIKGGSMWVVWTDDQWAINLKGKTKWRFVFAESKPEAEWKAREWFKRAYGFEYGLAPLGYHVGLKIVHIADWFKSRMGGVL